MVKNEELERRLAELLPPELKHLRIAAFTEIDSTNDEAKRRILSGETSPALIVAKRQTAGRGRMGRSFYSPEESGLYMTALLPPRSGEDCVTLTAAAAVAVYRAVKRTTGLETDIKWVNDIYLNRRKVCGILAEALPKDGKLAPVVGIGVNLRDGNFPAELSDIAGSLGTELSAEELAAAICGELFRLTEGAEGSSYMEDYRRRCFVLGKRVECSRNGERILCGTALSVDDDGALNIMDDTGNVKKINTGEISLRLE